MAWTSPRTWVANVTAITAAALNTDLRDNLNYLHDLLTGAAAGVHLAGAPATTLLVDRAGAPTAGRLGVFVGDGTAWNGLTTTSDENYFSSLNTVFHWVNWTGSGNATETLRLAASGKLTGNGFYDSGAQSIANGGTATLAHGLSARPRFCTGVWTATNDGRIASDTSTSTVALVTPSSTVSITTIDATNIVLGNSAGVTEYYRVFAML